MPRDERLKKRRPSPQGFENDVNSATRHGAIPITIAEERAGTPHMPASATYGRARHRKRYKGANRFSKYIRFLKRLARIRASKKGMSKHSTTSTTLKTTTFLFCLVAASFIIFKNDGNTKTTMSLRKKAQMMLPEFRISFSQKFSGSYSEPLFQNNTLETWLDFHEDYGGLAIRFAGRKRKISDSAVLLGSDFRHPEEERDDDGNDAYLAFDDDYLRGTEGVLDEGSPSGRVCRRTSGHRTNFQNCNTIFETEMLSNQVKYLNAGAYRQVFSLQHELPKQIEPIVVKDMYASVDFAAGDYEFVRMDAMVAERLSSSPRIYDIYGFCGLSILSEFFPHGDIEGEAVTGSGYLSKEEQEEQKLEGLTTYNDISPEQKLVMSLQMAEALADLHGDTDGVMVHQDVQLSQFLMNADKTKLKLNDFNRAEFMLWDDKEQEYCRYGEGAGNGSWRSPEEYFDHGLNEKVDVYSLGNNMYSLLTGLYPFFDEEHTKQIQERVKAGEKPYIDQRYNESSMAEAKLAEIIDRCHSYDPDDRPSIFEIVEFLRDALKKIRE